jgi:hypothetical protein
MDELKIPILFLEKLELLTDEERKVLTQTIHLLNNPMFVVNETPSNK